MITSDLAVITTTIITRDKTAVRAGKGPARPGGHQQVFGARRAVREAAVQDRCLHRRTADWRSNHSAMYSAIARRLGAGSLGVKGEDLLPIRETLLTVSLRAEPAEVGGQTLAAGYRQLRHHHILTVPVFLGREFNPGNIAAELWTFSWVHPESRAVVHRKSIYRRDCG